MSAAQVESARRVKTLRRIERPVLHMESCDVCSREGLCSPEDQCPKCYIWACPRCRHRHVYGCGRKMKGML